MDGYEVARRLRAQPGAERIRLVALTGWGQELDRQRTRLAGFDHHLTKPVAPLDLQALLSADAFPASPEIDARAGSGVGSGLIGGGGSGSGS
jgi:CheY-like chemotaxis protein